MGNMTEERTAEKRVALADLTVEMFVPLVGKTLVFERPAHPDASPVNAVRMKLLEAKRGVKSPAVRREPFSLLFALQDQPPLGLGLHRLLHPDFEPSDLLITRVIAPKYQAVDPEGMYYEAVFG
jgi:hypothetical protein